MYSKKNSLLGALSILNFVRPCKDPLDPLPTTTPEMSYESHPKVPTCSLPGYFLPFFVITLFCNAFSGNQVTKNLPLLLGDQITLLSLIPFSQEKDPWVTYLSIIKESL